MGLAIVAATFGCADADPLVSPARDPLRLVSLNPSITNIVLALDAQKALVGIDDWSLQLRPELEGLATVGGLFNPSLEAIVALQPDLVALVPSAQQRDIRARMSALGIEVLVLDNLSFEQVLQSIETLGARLGREPAARRRVAAIRSAWQASTQRSAARIPMRSVLVLQRDPLYLVGRGSFLDAMLEAAGAQNLGAEFGEEYPRAGVEWLIEVAPDLILDAAGDAQSARAHWSRWPSLPAVANGRIYAVPARDLTMPGPDLDDSLALLESLIDRARDESPGDSDTAPGPARAELAP